MGCTICAVISVARPKRPAQCEHAPSGNALAIPYKVYFTSPLCTERLKVKGVQISMDGRGRAFDNIFTERFWRSLKHEEVYLHDYGNPREARAGITRYMGLYNHKRPHEALSYQTPVTWYFDRPA